MGDLMVQGRKISGLGAYDESSWHISYKVIKY
jgi:hypothetical protein